MAKRVTAIIELAAFIALVVLGILWVWSKNGDYEPWTFVCGTVAIGLELHRRYFAVEITAPQSGPDDTVESLLAWLLANATSRELSETLPRAVRLAQKLGDKEFEKWASLELYGYGSENGMAATDMVPEYRAVTGYYQNPYGQMFRYDDPDLSIVNEDRFRFGVRQLEGYAKRSGMLYVRNEDMLLLIKQYFGFDAVQFGFNPIAILGVLDSIRGRLLDRLHRIKDGQRTM